MERDLTYVALDAIAFITGATLSAMLGHMQYRVDRATGRMSGYLLLWLLGFIWTFGNFMRCTLELAGATAIRPPRGPYCPAGRLRPRGFGGRGRWKTALGSRVPGAPCPESLLASPPPTTLRGGAQ